jgi:hypothetical protein
MTRFENFRRFQVFVESLMFHAWKKSPLNAWGKMFSLSTGICKKLQVNTEWRLALDRVVARNQSYQFKIKARNMRKSHDVFNSTPLANLSATRRLQNDFRSTFSWHESAWVKNFSSSHNTAKQRRFLSRMEHQTSTKTWNRLKFSTRDISKVYCSMLLWQVTMITKKEAWSGERIINHNNHRQRSTTLGSLDCLVLSLLPLTPTYLRSLPLTTSLSPMYGFRCGRRNSGNTRTSNAQHNTAHCRFW